MAQATSVARLKVACAAPANSSAAARPQRQEASLVASWRKARVARPVVLSASAQVQAAPRVSARSVAVKASAGSADETGVKYHFVVASATFMLDEEEHFQEQLKERLRWLKEKGTEQNFWLVFEPKFLQEFPEIAKRVKRPAVALVSTDATWITFMKLRLDRVLKGEFEASSQDDALEGKPFDISFPKPANWVAPYPKYEPTWWKPYAPAKAPAGPLASAAQRLRPLYPLGEIPPHHLLHHCPQHPCTLTPLTLLTPLTPFHLIHPFHSMEDPPPPPPSPPLFFPKIWTPPLPPLSPPFFPQDLMSVRGDAIRVPDRGSLVVFVAMRCRPSYHHLVAMAAYGDLDAANADDGDPSSSNWPKTGLDFLQGHVTEVAPCPLPEPSVDSEGWQFVHKAVPQSPPRQQKLESDDAEWQRPTRIEADPVVHDNSETTEFVTEAPESSNSKVLKRRRYTQTTIGFGADTPLKKPPPLPPPTVTPAPSPLKQTAAERAEAKFQEAQRNYITKWLPLFDWLLIDRGDDGLPCLRCSVCSEHGPDNARYGRNGNGGRDLQPASMRAHQASTRHEECIDRLKGLLDKLAAQKKVDDYERADPEGARVVRLMRSIQFVCDKDAPIAMFMWLVDFLAREGVSDIPQQGYGVYITECVFLLVPNSFASSSIPVSPHGIEHLRS
ncbi:unnamed protein product [Closterium sp. NIES-54]